MGAMSVVLSKACSTYAVTTVKSFVFEAVRTHGFLQCDNELTILPIAKPVIRELGGLKLRRYPTYSSQSLGTDERFHQSVLVQVRAFKLQVEQDYETKILTYHPLAPWLTRHSTWCLNRYVAHSDGQTSYQRRWLNTLKQPLCEVGETIMFRVPAAKKKSQREFEANWHEGLWLGRETSSVEVLIGTSIGVFKAKRVRRLPSSSKFNKQLLGKLKTVPWKHGNDGNFDPQVCSSRSCDEPETT